MVENIIVSTLKFTFVAGLYFLLAKFLFHHTFVNWPLIFVGNIWRDSRINYFRNLFYVS